MSFPTAAARPLTSSLRSSTTRSTLRTRARAQTHQSQQLAQARARPQFRSNSTQAQPGQAAQPVAGGLPQGVVGGLIGAGTVLAGGYGYYYFSGAKTMVDTARSASSFVSDNVKGLKNAAPAPNEALDWLKEQAYHYASFVPGGRKYVDTAFADLDTIREKHGDEVNAIVQSAYTDLQKITKDKGFSLDAASKSWDVLSDALTKVGGLAGDAAEDILKNHPELKDQFEQLKGYGESYGPEAKKQVDQTIEQVKGALAGGFSLETGKKLKNLIDDKRKELSKLGDAAWDKGLKEAKPYLDKNPAIKDLIEKNADALKSGKVNITELWSKVSAGNVDELKSYVESAVETGKSAASKATGVDIGSWTKMIPGGGEVFTKAQELSKLASTHGKDAEKLAQDTWKEVEEVLKKKIAEAQKIAEKAGKDAKKEATK